MNMLETVCSVGREFSLEFIRDPYICYTEQGHHAYFYNLLFSAVSSEQRFTSFRDVKLCTIQNEYPTNSHLGRSQRQHWDISVIKTPVTTTNPNDHPFDYLRLDVVAEFGMNAHIGHLEDDVERMTHADANADNLVAFHFYRLGEVTHRFSHRDISEKSKSFASCEECIACIGTHPVHLFYAVYNPNGEKSAWYFYDGNLQRLIK